MGQKRKRTAGDSEQMKRFRSSVENLVATEAKGTEEEEGEADPKSKVIRAKSRKLLRKETRKLKKMRRNAFLHKEPLPTIESVAAEKQKKKDDRLKRKKKFEKQKQKRIRKRQKLRDLREEKEKAQKELELLNKADNKTLRDLEKKLKMKKGKGLPSSFAQDNMDYILNYMDEATGIETFLGGENEETTGKKLKKNEVHKDGSNDDDDDDDSSQDGSEDDGSNEEEEDEDSNSFEDEEEEMEVSRNEEDDDEEDDDDGEDDDENDVDDEDDESVNDEIEADGICEEDDGENEDDEDGDDDDEDEDGDDDDEDGDGDDDDDNDESMNDKLKNQQKKGILKSVSTEKGKKSVKFAEEGENKKDSAVKPTSTGLYVPPAKRLQLSVEESEKTENQNKKTEKKEKKNENVKGVVKEDIYGRLRDEEGNVVKPTATGAYVPPARRLQTDVDTDDRMKRQIHGLVNRLSENQIQSFTTQLEEMFRTYSRAAVSDVLTKEILKTCITNELSQEKMCMNCAVVLAALHSKIGVEISASFLQALVFKFVELFECKKSDVEPDTENQIENALILLSQLYNFKIIECNLLYEVIRKLVERFLVKDISSLVAVFKDVGFVLRKDDPKTFQEVYFEIQQKANEVDQEDVQKRLTAKNLLDVLLAVKNNNTHKIATYDKDEVLGRMKILKAILKDKASAAIQVSLDDLLSYNTQGKWWLVGSAWSGRDHSSNKNAKDHMNDDHGKFLSKVESSLLDQARKQRMNTTVRKMIFCTIMTSDDYKDAFEKLLKLNLTTQQQREIIHVIVDLCQQEKVYNPFYAYLAQQFCVHNRQFLMAVQFTAWDRLRVLAESSEQKIDNLADFLIHLIVGKTLSLSVFKILEFAELDKMAVHLLCRVLRSILINEPDFVAIFSRIAGIPKLKLLRDSLKVFMRHFLYRKKRDESIELLRKNIELAETALNSVSKLDIKFD